MTSEGAPADPGAEHWIFVYGTLKRGGTNHRLLAGQRFIGPARTTAGHRLYGLGEYPGLVIDPADRTGVQGEVWAVDRATLAALDAFEGVPEGLYRRAAVPLAPPFHQRAIDTYLYLRDVRGCPDLQGHWPVD